MISRRLATISAMLGLIAALVAPFRVERVFVANTGQGPGNTGFWMIVPIALAAAALAAVRAQSAGWIWGIVGAVWGFVIIAAWSLGTFFAWEGLALLVAGILHLIAVNARWRALLVPLWLIAGATSLGPVFLAVDVTRELRSHGSMIVTHAPVVVYSSWACGAAIAAIIVLDGVARRFTPRG